MLAVGVAARGVPPLEAAVLNCTPCCNTEGVPSRFTEFQLTLLAQLAALAGISHDVALIDPEGNDTVTLLLVVPLGPLQPKLYIVVTVGSFDSESLTALLPSHPVPPLPVHVVAPIVVHDNKVLEPGPISDGVATKFSIGGLTVTVVVSGPTEPPGPVQVRVYEVVDSGLTAKE